MPSNRRRARRLAVWRRYQKRIDRLITGQTMTYDLRHPMHMCPGFFRAEGWNTGARNRTLRHGV